MRNLRVLQKIETDSTIHYEEIAYSDHNGQSDGTVEVEAVNSDSNKTSIIVELLVVADSTVEEISESEQSELNNTFYMVCNDQWINVIRNRNFIKVVVSNNYGVDYRSGVLSFFHNAVSEIAVNVSIVQVGTEYSVTINNVGPNNTVNLNSLFTNSDPNDNNFKEELVFPVSCTGGRENFKVCKVKKFGVYEIENNEGGTDLIAVQKQYDDAFVVIKDGDEIKITNYGNINCHFEFDNSLTKKQLIVNDYYYEIPVRHIDCVDANDKITVKYKGISKINAEPQPITKIGVVLRKPETYLDTDYYEIVNDILVDRLETNHGNLGDLTSLLDKIQEGIGVTPEIDVLHGEVHCDIERLVYGSEGGVLSVSVTTIPQDAAVNVSYYGDMIDKCEINGHNIKIYVNKNPFSIDRECICYIKNAMYPDATYNLSIKQGHA